MAKYRIMETTAAKHPDYNLRRKGDSEAIFYVQRRFLGMWFYIDWWYSVACCESAIERKLGRSPVDKRDLELRATPDKVIRVVE